MFGNQQDAAIGYNPAIVAEVLRPTSLHGSQFLLPLGCRLRAGNAGTWDGIMEVLDLSLVNVPREIRELRVRADAGFGFNPVLLFWRRAPHNMW